MVWTIRWQVIIREYYVSSSANRHHVNQSLRGSGSINSDLAQGLNQCVSVSVRRCQQAPNRNTSLGALLLPQNLIILPSDLFMSGHPLQGSNGCGELLSYHPTPANNILYIGSVNIINIWNLNLINI